MSIAKADYTVFFTFWNEGGILRHILAVAHMEGD